MSTRFTTLRSPALVLALLAGVSTSACAPTASEQRDQLRCAGGVVTGAAVGGFLGNQFGSGSGNKIMTTGGAVAGGAAGASAAC